MTNFRCRCVLVAAGLVCGSLTNAAAAETPRVGSAEVPLVGPTTVAVTTVRSASGPSAITTVPPGAASEPLQPITGAAPRDDGRASIAPAPVATRTRVSVDLPRTTPAVAAQTTSVAQRTDSTPATFPIAGGSPVAEGGRLPDPSAGTRATGVPRDVQPSLEGGPVGSAVTSDSSSEDAAAQPKAYGSLWERLRAGFSMQPVDSPLVDRHVEWYLNRPAYVQRLVERGRRYMHFIVEEVEKRGMPLEIALLPMIESAYNPAAYSKAHAAGMWQFIPTTGKNYGLQQNWWYDGRRDVTAATRAALDYLQKLYGDFGDWHLALAAYNWGEGAVSRAIAHNQRSGLPSDYNSLRMPAETRNYLPKLQAVKNLVAEPERYGLALDEVPNEPYFIRVAAPGHIDFKRAAQLAETPLDEFKSLNPAFNRPVIAASGEQSLLIPAEKIDAFNANLKASDAPLLSWQTYRLPRHERVEAVAARFHTSAALLRQVNGVSANGRLKAGSTLLVPRDAAPIKDAPDALDTLSFLPPQVLPDARFHRARRGETLQSIAAHYGIPLEQLNAWNRVKGGKLRPGQRVALVAPSAVKSVRMAKGRPVTTAKAVASKPPSRQGQRVRNLAKLKPGAAPSRGRCCAPTVRPAHLARR